jgi:hypothetical protein
MKPLHSLAGVILTVTVFASAPVARGQAAPAPPGTLQTDGPRIRFSETNFNFGKVKTSDLLRHEFIVTNTGNAVLEISSVRPGCGCTMAGTWDRQIQPGQTGKIPIQFSPANFAGPVTKSIAVTCNDPTQTNHTLQIAATIWRPIDVQPPNAYFSPVEGETNTEVRVVRIVSNLDEPLTLEPPQCTNRTINVELKTVQPGKEFELHVQFVGPHSNSIPNSFISLKTSSTNLPEISVPIYTSLRPAFAPVPNRIFLSTGPSGAGYRSTTTIRNNSNTPVKLTDATVNADGVTVQIAETQPGRLFTLNLNFPTNFQAQAGHALELSVKTTHPSHPVIKVPIIAVAAPARPSVPTPLAAPVGAK